MRQHKLDKARSCKLFYRAPVGYVRISSEEMVLDPDPQVQAVVRLIFAKFVELGSCRKLLHYLRTNKILTPVRSHSDSPAGQLQWHSARPDTLYAMLHHPIYAGAYVHGRIRLDPQHKIPGRSNGQSLLPWEQWKVLRKDALPAYITWEQYLDNQHQLSANHGVSDPGELPHEGASLVEGLVFCGHCNRQMQIENRIRAASPRFLCRRDAKSNGDLQHSSVEVRLVDELVGRQVLESLQPIGLRSRLKERGNHAPMHRQPANQGYSSVWESILALATEIPALWNAPFTTFADRQIIIRQLLERIVIDIHENTENVMVALH